MDTRRLVLLLVFSFSALMLWDAWRREHMPPAPPAASANGQKQNPGVPDASVPASSAAAPASGAVPGTPTPAPAVAAEKIVITTDLYKATINTAGGIIEEVEFTQHRDTLDKAKPFVLMQKSSAHTHVAQSGLLGTSLPTHYTVFAAAPGTRDLGNKDSLELRMTAPDANGVVVEKVFTFHRGRYVIDVAFDIANQRAEALRPSAYFQLVRDSVPPVGENKWVSAFNGIAVYTEADKYKKIDFSELDKGKDVLPKDKKFDNGWVGMVQHYFVTAWLPGNDGLGRDSKVEREFYAKKLDDGLYSAGVKVPGPEIAPNAKGRIMAPLYVGPQEQDYLEKLSPGLDLTVDYGIFTAIAKPLFALLQWLYKVVGNWGWAIILMTVLIKAVFYPLNATAARSMAKMKVVGPKMKALQEQYGSDKQKFQQAMMELYKKEKINPFGGCLPILVQIPVFIALYWVLLGAVELRHAPWIGYIKDLSAPDPWYIMPVIYAISAWAQVKMQPPSPGMDPTQQKMMQIMPVAFSVLFFFFPAGLVLYWIVSNVLGIAQQWYVNRMLEKEAAAAAAKRR